MGLDMYLNKHVYVGANWAHNNVTGKISLKRGDKKIPVNFDKVKYVVEEAGYWRKANAIHKWFVDNVQEGEDDCELHYVDRTKLEQLLETCKKVKESLDNSPTELRSEGEYKVYLDTKLAEELLPHQSGFFFGGTEYDIWYYNDLVYTINMLEEELKSEFFGEYYYQSSW